MPQVVKDAGELAALVDRLLGEPEIAVDVEGDGLFRYRARLCTVQVATRAEVVVVDTLALDDLAPLAQVLGPDGPRKVLHDVGYDARLLADYGIRLGRVFDTALAARFLGEPSTGLAAVLERRFGLRLPKEQQRADWGKRPFTDEALGYLAADVRHLLALGEALEAEVREAGIEAEVREESEYLLWRALTDEPADRPPWTRIKGRDELGAVGLAVLREVAEERERAAQRLDVPPFKVTGNQELLEVARRRPRTPADLQRIRGFARGRARSLTRAFLEAVRRGEDAGAVPAEESAAAREPALPPEEREARKRRQRALSGWRVAEAEARGVDPQVVLPGHCLSDLAARGPDTLEDLLAIPGLGAFRVERYGERLLEVLQTQLEADGATGSPSGGRACRPRCRGAG